MNKSNIGYRILKFSLSPIFKILYRPKVINSNFIPTKGSIILCGNHINEFDPLLVVISTRRPIYFLAKKELFTGIKKIFFKIVNCISVDRDGNDFYAKESVIKFLKEGKAIGIFPEGTRNKSKDILLPFKYGTVSFAKKTNAFIVPFVIIGKFKILTKNLKIVFGEPFKIQNMELEAANKILYEKVKKLLIENNKVME